MNLWHTDLNNYRAGINTNQANWESAARLLYPEDFKVIDEERRLAAQRRADAMYLDPYLQATGEFLEYVCGVPLAQTP